MTNAYQIVTERIVNLLEQGVNPWRKSWSTAAHRPPTNLISRKAYRGINNLLLGLAPYASPYWLTYKQAAALGGNVRKGEKASLAIFWTKHRYSSRKNPDGTTTSLDHEYETPIMKFYHVFNAEQCEGLDVPATPAPQIFTENEAHARAEAILAGMPNAPRFEHAGEQPCYMPDRDLIRMPALVRFKSSADYYSTRFHELAHSTGHKSRLARDLSGMFGNEKYAREELIAEMTAAYLCGACGILEQTEEQSAAYLHGWAQKIKQEPRAIITAAAKAQAAADYIMNNQPEHTTSEGDEG